MSGLTQDNIDNTIKEAWYVTVLLLLVSRLATARQLYAGMLVHVLLVLPLLTIMVTKQEVGL